MCANARDTAQREVVERANAIGAQQLGDDRPDAVDRLERIVARRHVEAGQRRQYGQGHPAELRGRPPQAPPAERAREDAREQARHDPDADPGHGTPSSDAADERHDFLQ